MNASIVPAAILLAATLGTAVGEIVSEEVRGRLDKIPTALLRCAVRRLPSSLRDDLFEEWSAELDEILRGAEALPITRLVVGARFALGMLRTGPDIGRTLANPTDNTSTNGGEAAALTSPAALLQAAAAGDANAWGRIVDAYGRLVWSVARGSQLSIADTSEVSHQTWLRLVENLDRIQNPDELAGWLATTARRESLRIVGMQGSED